jgi:alkylated DNA nucleotide flippase Atl1
MRPEFVDAVLRVAAMVPKGHVLTYGDVAELLGAGGPRQVGRVMSQYGSEVAWWRIVRADGTLPDGLLERALPRYEEERTPLSASGLSSHRIAMCRARWLPSDSDLARIEVLSRKLSEPAVGMDQ